MNVFPEDVGALIRQDSLLLIFFIVSNFGVWVLGSTGVNNIAYAKDFNGLDLFGDAHTVPDGYDGVNYDGAPVGKEVTVDSNAKKIELEAINYNGVALINGVDVGRWGSQPFGIYQIFLESPETAHYYKITKHQILRKNIRMY